MAQVSRMTAQEARDYVGKNNAKLQVAYESAVEFEADEPGKFIGRGFAAFKEYINKNGRPKVDDKKILVSIRLPESAIASLRATGSGWQTRVSNYVVKGVNRGALNKLAV